MDNPLVVGNHDNTTPERLDQRQRGIPPSTPDVKPLFSIGYRARPVDTSA